MLGTWGGRRSANCKNSSKERLWCTSPYTTAFIMVVTANEKKPEARSTIRSFEGHEYRGGDAASGSKRPELKAARRVGIEPSHVVERYW